MGERKMAAIPAAIPTTRSIRRSVAGRCMSRAYTDPTPAAASAIGPSRPAEPPDPIVNAEAMSLIGVTRGRRIPCRRWNALDDRVGAMSFRLGGEPLHEDADQQTTHSGGERHEPEA